MSQQWTDLQRYVIEEHFEDYTEGRISRRELLKRVSYITGGVAASLAALSALGCNVDQPRALATGAASPAPTANPPSPQPNVPFATPPAAATTNPVTVRLDDPRLRAANPVGIPSGDGRATLIGYEACYLLFFVALVGLLRGGLLFGLLTQGISPALAIGVETLVQATWHLGKPMGEALGSPVWGIVGGLLSIRCRSVWPAVFAHFVLNVLIDVVALSAHQGALF